MALSDEEIVQRFGFNDIDYTNEQNVTRVDIVDAFLRFAEFLNEIVPDGRYKSLMLTDLESAESWANKAVTDKK